jgi:branched-chain amino acid transport system ATP-binding protein
MQEGDLTMQQTPILQVDDIAVTYNGLASALDGVSLSVPDGAIVALLGGNGAGKTTTLRAVSSLLRAERGALARGAIVYRGADVTDIDPWRLVERGIVQVLEGRRCFGHLSVEDNLRIGAFVRRPSVRGIADALERVYAIFPRLEKRRRTAAGYTSGGEQQMIAIGRALMSRPSLVLLDEPSMGLAPQIVEEIFDTIAQLNREEGVSFVLAEQNASIALRYADQAYVLESGRVVGQGAPEDLVHAEVLCDAYLGAGRDA